MRKSLTRAIAIYVLAMPHIDAISGRKILLANLMTMTVYLPSFSPVFTPPGTLRSRAESAPASRSCRLIARCGMTLETQDSM